MSDAGTPAISDPSFRVVQKAHEIGAKVVPIPGAVAFVNAVNRFGFADRFAFFSAVFCRRKKANGASVWKK